MTDGIYTVAAGGMAALERLDVVTQNLANAKTAGYKAARVVFRVGGEGDEPAITVTQTRDMAPGAAQTSGNPLDLALLGEGFFVVATPRGERLTRHGAFTLDAEGYLATADGDRVQGTNGDLRIGAAAVTVGEDGAVTLGGGTVVDRSQIVDRLLVVGVEPENLVAEGSSRFTVREGVVPERLEPGRIRIAQHAIEASNVDAVASLVELIDVSRGYEAYMQALQRLDDTANTAINEIGRIDG